MDDEGALGLSSTCQRQCQSVVPFAELCSHRIWIDPHPIGKRVPQLITILAKQRELVIFIMLLLT